MFYASKETAEKDLPINWLSSEENTYLIIDMIHYENTAHEMSRCFYNRTKWFRNSISLFQGTIDEELGDIAPYLCKFTVEDRDMESKLFLEMEEKERNSLIWITSTLEIDDLHPHLQHFLAAKLKNGREALLRFYDPRVTTTFLEMLKIEQARGFWEKVSQISLWDNEIQQRVIYRRDIDA